MSSPSPSSSHSVVLIGSGPAGLIAAETLARAGIAVTVYERMPSVGRKFLMAGRGGLNLTHSETLENFLPRYGTASDRLRPMIEAFPPSALRDWADDLGQETFVGSSGRIFPRAMKASPLLRAWLGRLSELGVTIRTGQTWTGWDEAGALQFSTRDGAVEAVMPDATLLALGGASWPRLGTDGGWVETLAAKGVAIAPLRPSNCGFEISWTDIFRDRFAGQPLKTVALSFDGRTVRGDAMITGYGIEGGAIYALSAPLRDAIARDGQAVLTVDLTPNLPLTELTKRLSAPWRRQSLSNVLRKLAGLSPLAVNLLREGGEALPDKADALARRLKSVPLTLTATRPIDRAISTAGGIGFDALNERLMLHALPGVFAAGEMLDWEAPTGGYLLQASFATGVAAAKGMLDYLGITSASAI